jgi:hypothetical protein
MTKDEALKQALRALENCYDVESYPADGDTPQDKAITAIKEDLAQPVQEGEPDDKFCDANCVWTDHHPHCKLAQPEERYFCPRCGKRTADLTTIHTCTPPRGNT